MIFQYGKNCIRYKDFDEEKIFAEISFTTEDGVATVENTFVDPVLKGHGIAEQLCRAAAEEFKKRGLKVRFNCSYAKSWFEKHPEYREMME